MYPKYTKKPFEFIVADKDGKNISDKASFQYTTNNGASGEKNNATYERTPQANYDGSDVFNYIYCKATIDKKTLHINVPIYQHLNLYGHSAINGWNGNSIDLGGNADNAILAPQVGAGKKENNKFTGVLIGSIKNNGNGAV